MGDYVQRSRDSARNASDQATRPPADAAGTVAQMMNRSARVRVLTAQSALLNGAVATVQRVVDPEAPVQLMPGGGRGGRGGGRGGGGGGGGGGKKSQNQKKQDKAKNRAAGAARGKARRVEKVVRSAQTYTGGKVNAKATREAAVALLAEGAKLRGGHSSKRSGFGVNAGTAAGNAKIFSRVKETAAREKEEKKKWRGKGKESESDDDEAVDDEDYSYDGDSGGSDHHDHDQGGAGGAGAAAGGGGAAIAAS
jgi:hypothetical protein